ncbi:uncharacterized protein [Panulirus ornatus]|uniref:uncharacterized protein n=1 Tax=Panulirus ornatus TaxID=150431 RepID=UPI003A861080
MALWTSLALLSALAVSALSLPQPDESAYKIPQVGTGRRSQYYVLHKDGTFKYGYDTGEGAFERARSPRVGKVDGDFGYTDPDGNNVYLQYQADEGGFVAKGDHIPAPHPDFAAAHAAARARPPFVDPLADPTADASYGFQFAEGGQARAEQSDSDGNVRGSYTYTDEEGRTRTYTYTAGRGTGFVIEGDDLPQAPEAPGATPAATRLSSSAGRFSASSATGTTSSTRPSQTSATPSTTFRASAASRPSSTPFSATPGSPAGAVSYQRSGAQSDASYSFAYDAGDHSRSESADADLNVEGQFSFVADDGVTRKVTYEAGSDTGFLAEGDHLPQAPQSPVGSQTTSPSLSRPQTSFRSPAAARTPSFPDTPAGSPTPSFPGTSAGFPTTSYRGTPAGARPSSFPGTPAGSPTSSFPGTPAGASPSSFSGTPAGFPTPSFSGTPTGARPSSFSGTPAGARPSSFSGTPTGARPSSFSGTPAGSPTPSFSGTPAGASPSSFSGTPAGASPSSFSGTPAGAPTPSFPGTPAGASPSSFSSRPLTRQQGQPFEPANTRSQLSPDGSYSFAYETSSHSRAESGDKDNNVVGDFDFVADDGQRRAIQYEASSATGFIAEGAHIPVGPKVPGAPSGQPTGRIVPVQEVPFIDPLADSSADASYDFAFDSEQYSRTETADADGNVQGTYTVVDDDGTRRTYRFRAGEGVGFETEQVSSSRGPPPSRPASATFRGAASTGQVAAPSSPGARPSSGPASATFRGVASPGQAATSSTTFSSQTGAAFATSAASSAFSTASAGSRLDASSNIKLHQYGASENCDKSGYVLTFD